MRLAWFFVVSIGLHSVALVVPISLHQAKLDSIIGVQILPIETDGDGGRAKGGGEASAAAKPRREASRPKLIEPAIGAAVSASEAQFTPSLFEVPAKPNEANIALAAVTLRPEAVSSESSSSTGIGLGGNGAGGTGSGGSGVGSGSSSGSGSGRGSGQGISANGVALIQARYRDTPKPEYPESARRESREGRVLLRVLVDDQGRAKQIDINSSSGSDALDRAAADAIRRWRFHPAHYGDQPIESWLRIPIEFHLADAKNW